jgi:hypothetical protein
LARIGITTDRSWNANLRTADVSLRGRDGFSESEFAEAIAKEVHQHIKIEAVALQLQGSYAFGVRGNFEQGPSA